MSKPARAAILGPSTVVPIGSVLVCMSGLFGLAKYVARIEFRTDTNTQGIAELREQQRASTNDVNDALDAQSRDLSDLKQLQAATAAKLSVLIEHFGLEPRKRRR